MAVASIVILLGVVVFFWWGLRTTKRHQRPPQASDLLRADDAESQSMPTASEVTEAVEGMFWRGQHR